MQVLIFGVSVVMKKLVMLSGVVPLLIGLAVTNWIYSQTIGCFGSEYTCDSSVYVFVIGYGLPCILLIFLGYSMFTLNWQALLFGKILFSLLFVVSLAYNLFYYWFAGAYVEGSRFHPLDITNLIHFFTAVFTPPLDMMTLWVILPPISLIFIIVLSRAKKKMPELFSPPH